MGTLFPWVGSHIQVRVVPINSMRSSMTPKTKSGVGVSIELQSLSMIVLGKSR